jgi:hypothetical protein
MSFCAEFSVMCKDIFKSFTIIGENRLKLFQDHFTPDFMNRSQNLFRSPKHPIRDFLLQHSKESKITRTQIWQISWVGNAFKHFSTSSSATIWPLWQIELSMWTSKVPHWILRKICILSLTISARILSMNYSWSNRDQMPVLLMSSDAGRWRKLSLWLCQPYCSLRSWNHFTPGSMQTYDQMYINRETRTRLWWQSMKKNAVFVDGGHSTAQLPALSDRLFERPRVYAGSTF